MQQTEIKKLLLAAVMALAVSTSAQPVLPITLAAMNYRADWRWVHGAVFVPTSAVN